jgi:hypothetical protein
VVLRPEFPVTNPVIVAAGAVSAFGQTSAIGSGGFRFSSLRIAFSSRERHVMNTLQQEKVEVKDAA